MATINSIQIAVTSEGLEQIAAAVGEQTIFTISKFRLTDMGDEIFYESKKSFTGLDPDAFYMPITTAEFESDHGIGAIDLSSHGLSDTNGFITVNSVGMADTITVEIECYIPPTAGTSFACNEIMIYTGPEGGPHRTFMWGIFPEITKQAQYGINFKALLQF